MVAPTMSRSSPVSVLGALAIILMAGCASSQMSRIDRNRDAYETWPVEVRQSILDGKVEQGMTPEMVEVAWGRPTEIESQGGPGNEVWVYKSGGDDGSVLYPNGASYPAGGVYGGNRPSIGVAVGNGGVLGGGVGIGGGGMGYPGGGMGYPGGGMGYPGGGYPRAGMGGPVMVSGPTPPDVKEVVFRNGVVYKADSPVP